MSRFSDRQKVLLAAASVLCLVMQPALGQVRASAIPAYSAEKRDFTGTVLDAATGKPLKGATVSLAYAHPREGTSPFCPSCWADCAKHQLTNASGSFRIDAPDPSLLFTVLVVRDGYKPAFFRNTDPGKGAATFRLTRAHQDSPHDPQIVRGRILGPDGKPIVGASISANGYAQTREGRTFGGVPQGMDPLVVTGHDGTFAFHVAPPYRHVLLEIDAPGMVTRLSGWQEAGKAPITLRMTLGATVTGHVRGPDGQALSGLSVCWIQKDRDCERYVGRVTIGTDRNGDFVLNNVAPQEASVVNVASEGKLAAADLVVPLTKLTTASDGSVSSIPTLQAVKAAIFRGRLQLTDGHPVPPHTRILFGREEGWDPQQVLVAPDGTFTLHGIPPGETMHLVVRIPGYQVDRKTPGLDSYQPQFGNITFTAPTAGPQPERTFLLHPAASVKK